MAESRKEVLEKRLKELQRMVPEIEGAAVVSSDGLMIASSLSGSISEDRVAAMSAALISVADRIGRELERGNLEMGLVRGERGYVVMVNAGEEAALVVLTTKDAKLGLVFLEVKRAAKDISELL